MRLLTWNSAVGCHKSFLILIIAVLGALVGSCRGSSMDGVSLRFNKRGEGEKLVNEFSIRTSAHEMWTFIKSHLAANRRKKAKKEIMKASSMFRIHGNKFKISAVLLSSMGGSRRETFGVCRVTKLRGTRWKAESGCQLEFSEVNKASAGKAR